MKLIKNKPLILTVNLYLKLMIIKIKFQKFKNYKKKQIIWSNKKYKKNKN